MSERAAPLPGCGTSPWVALVCRRADALGVLRLGAALTATDLVWKAVHPRHAWDPAAPPAVAVCRLPSGTDPSDLARLVQLEASQTVFLDPPSLLMQVHDKAQLLGRLAAAGLPVPPTRLVLRGDACDILEGLPGETFVVKPASGCSGHGVTMGLRRAQASRAARVFADASGPVLVQPVLGAGIDRRLFLVDGRVVAAMERRPAPADRTGRANLAQGGQARALVPDERERELALAVADLTGLKILGVDLLVTDQGPIVLEANTCPGLAGIEAATGQDVASQVAKAVRERLV